MAALDNNVGVVGVAPETYLYSLKVLDANGSGSYSNIISAIQWCIDNKMQVVNMSFGGSSFSQALSDICDKANSAGILLIAAAGNSGGNSGQDTIGYPAKLPSVMAIAATDSSDARASFSSVGPELSVAAPGVSIPSTVPTGSCKLCDPSGYKQLSGTSMACPHTVGTAVLVLKNSPNLTNVDVRKAIENTAVDLGQQGHDDLYGWGRIDAYAAVTQTPPPPPGPLASITISPTNPTINVGGTVQLTATCKDQNDSVITCPTLTWTSDNTAVATVDQTGKVNGVSNGTANVTTSSGTITSNISTITVVKSSPPPTSKFNVQILGQFGILVLKNPNGQYDANGACTIVCDKLKTM